MFKELRGDLGWGPENELWAQLYPRFYADVLMFTRGWLSTIESDIESTLAQRFTEGELIQLTDFLRSAQSTEVMELSRSIKLDPLSASMSIAMAKNPNLYSSAEKSARALAMTGKEEEVQAALEKVNPWTKALRNLQWDRVISVSGQLLLEKLEAAQHDATQRQSLEKILVEWRERVRR